MNPYAVLEVQIDIYPSDWEENMYTEEEARQIIQGINFDTVVDTILQTSNAQYKAFSFEVNVDGFETPYRVILVYENGRVRDVTELYSGYTSSYNGVYAQ